MLLAAAEESGIRDSKHFSLFSVVTFKNEECTSESTFSGGQIQGTCYTSTECSDKSGTKSGNCAAGFGVCCVFVSATGVSATIAENRTYLQNPLFPAIETSGTGTSIVYTINKCQADICQVRLDFENFVIAGPVVTDEGPDGDTTDYTNCNDKLVTATSSGFAVPTLCGVMTGEHIYMDIGATSTDTATLTLTLASTTIVAGSTTVLPSGITTANAMRTWRIKTSQIPCYAPYRAPQGCHRYFTQISGTIISPNFAYGPSTTAGTNMLNSGHDLMGQNLRTCLRREKGMCCTLFQVCSFFGGTDLTQTIAGGNFANGLSSLVSQGWSFMQDLTVGAGGLTTNAIFGMDMGLVDYYCTGDYVEIPDSTSGTRDYAGGNNAQVNTRYCGTRLGFTGTAITVAANSLITGHAPVWDCSEPWEVNYRTNIYSDENAVIVSTTANDIPADLARGFCLDFSQQAC